MKVNSEVLYELINDGSIKPGTKLKVYKDDIYVTTITFDGYDFIWETGTFTSGMLFNPLVDFELIEEDKEIEKLEKRVISQNLMLSDKNAPDNEKWNLVQKLIYDNSLENQYMKDKINELINEINKLKRGK